MRRIYSILGVVGTVSVRQWRARSEPPKQHRPQPLYIDEVQHGIKQPIAFSECRAGGSTCRIDSGKSVSSTISGNVGVSFGALNAALGGSYQETYTATTSCTSPMR